MEEFDYGSLLIIVAFWCVVVLIIMIVVCRLKHMKRLQELARNQNEQTEPRRVIQIYYIENAEGSQELSGHAGNILNKILPRLEDQHPPSYEEATVTSFSEITSRSEGFDGGQQSVSTRPNETGASNNADIGLGSNHDTARNDVVIVVDRTLPAS